DFSQLGDDRWFAMQGAIGIYQEPVIIVDAGTALTVDSVIDGKHQGGFIVPGLYTMRKSLASNTNNLQHYSQSALASHSSDNNLLANNTAEAILGGTLYMVAAFINQIVNDLNSQIGTSFKLILTGGESVNICRLLDSEFDYIPDLVLQGMVNVEECVKK
ncbi:MAG: type III pantothenate kinase, partial [Thiomicrorhabdus sp.]|nr:type III pantothenate kinase [Thiomicrorhabdus sp.]